MTPGPVWPGAENLALTEIRSLDRSAHSRCTNNASSIDAGKAGPAYGGWRNFS